MPEYTFTGLVPTAHPDSKDAAGAPVGEVEPGEIRDLTEAPDGMWREATDDDWAARAGVLKQREAIRLAALEPAGTGAPAARPVPGDAPAAETPPVRAAAKAKAAPGTDTAGTAPGSKEN